MSQDLDDDPSRLFFSPSKNSLKFSIFINETIEINEFYYWSQTKQFETKQ